MGLPHTYGALTVGQVGVEVEVEDAQLPQVGFLLQQEAHEVAAQEAAAARHNEHQTRDGGRRLWGTNVGHGCGAGKDVGQGYEMLWGKNMRCYGAGTAVG